jgi:hypothetical protein
LELLRIDCQKNAYVFLTQAFRRRGLTLLFGNRTIRRMELWAILTTISLNAIAITLAWVGRKERNNMAALANLTSAIVNLAAAIDIAVVRLTVPSTPDADVQLAADSVNGQTARIVAALTPVP